MGREDEYRARAQEAERDARLLTRIDEREAMLRIARSWHELADMEARKQEPSDG